MEKGALMRLLMTEGWHDVCGRVVVYVEERGMGCEFDW